MASTYQSDDEDDDDNLGLDEDFYKQMEALKQACQLRDQNDASEASESSGDESEDSDDEVLRSIQKKLNSFSGTNLESQAAGHDTDEEVDEDTILRSVQKFCGSLGLATVRTAEKEVSTSLDRPAASQGIGDCLELSLCSHERQGIEQVVDSQHEAEGSDEERPSIDLQAKLRTLFTALNQNRSCQRLLRTLMHQVELKQSENKVLQARVKSTIGSEKSWKKRSAGLFSTKLPNPILTFMTNLKRRVMRKHSETPADAPASAPPENPDVAKFRMLKEKLPLTFVEKKWTAEEKAELAKGVKQQIQESRVRRVMEVISSRGLQDVSTFDEEIKRIGEEVMTAKDIQEALPTVDWSHVARIYVVGRSPSECKLQWLNYEDPSINKGPWSKLEDKKLLIMAQEYNSRHWETIGRQLGTNRTPAQCLARYQRSLNASIMRSSWTEEEDKQLRNAVERLGENDWQTVAATLEGRTGAQCSNRWYKVLHPTIQRKGRWDLEEDKRLKWAVSVCGPQKWRVIASHVPGRTDIQCRERWVNVLDPSVNISPWTSEEDEKLEKLVGTHGQHRWAKVAKGMNRRTDSQCWRRWKTLHPENQASFHLDNQITKAALPSNFVGRVKERTKLGPQDFIAGDSHVKAPKRRPGRPTKSNAAIDDSGAQDNPESAPQPKRKARSSKKSQKAEGQVDTTLSLTGTTSPAPGNPQSVDEFVGLVRMFDSFCKYASKLNPDIRAPGYGADVDRQSSGELQDSSGIAEEPIAASIPEGTVATLTPGIQDGVAEVGHDMTVSSVSTDLQVAAATRAILSWPFAMGMADLCATTNHALVQRKRKKNSGSRTLISTQQNSQLEIQVRPGTHNAVSDLAADNIEREDVVMAHSQEATGALLQVGTRKRHMVQRDIPTNNLQGSNDDGPQVGPRKKQRVQRDVSSQNNLLAAGIEANEPGRRTRQRKQADLLPAINLQNGPEAPQVGTRNRKKVDSLKSTKDTDELPQFGKRQTRIVVVPASSLEESIDFVGGRRIRSTRLQPSEETDVHALGRPNRKKRARDVLLAEDSSRSSKSPRTKKRGIEEIVNSVATDRLSVESTGNDANSTKLLKATPEVETRDRRRKRVGPPCELPGRDDATEGLLAVVSFESNEARKKHCKKTRPALPAQQPQQEDSTRIGTGKRRRKLTCRLISSDG